MDSRVIIAVDYRDTNARDLLAQAFIEVLGEQIKDTLFIAIGTDKHLLDCLGPLTGTMLEEYRGDFKILGTLQNPWHAGNLVDKLRQHKALVSQLRTVAIDASIGKDEPSGIIKFKLGPIKPGKAVQKVLPGVGDYAITGLVGSRPNRRTNPQDMVTLADIYAMSRVISDAVINWQQFVNHKQ